MHFPYITACVKSEDEEMDTSVNMTDMCAGENFEIHSTEKQIICSSLGE